MTSLSTNKIEKNIFKVTISLCVILLYYSCSKPPQDELCKLPPSKSIYLESTYNIQDRSYYNMMISDSLLLLIANKDSNFFHVFNKETLSPITSFGKKGNARFEFSNIPFFIKQGYNDKEYFEVFDIKSTKRVGIKNIINGSSVVNEIKSEQLDDELAVSRSLSTFDNSFIVGTSLEKIPKGLFYVHDKQSKKKTWASYNPKVKDKKDYYNSIYYGEVQLSPDAETVVYCPRHFDRVLFFNKKAELIKVLNFSEVRTPNIEEEAFGVTDDEIIYSYQTYATKDYIYVLRPMHSLNDLINEVSPINIQILKLTWNGDISEVYEHSLKQMPNLFCIDEEQNRVIFNISIDDGTAESIYTEISVYNLFK